MSPARTKHSAISIMQRLITIFLALAAGACSMPLSDEFPSCKTGEFEGDIKIHPSQVGRNGITDVKYRWPNATVYYTIQPTFTDAEKEVILKAIDELHSRTCVRLVERNNQKNYVVFGNSDDQCYSSVGMVGGAQVINATPLCLSGGTSRIIHLMLHALGFWHQHNAPSRDDWVTIKWENINTTALNCFKKYDSSVANEFGVEYDYASIVDNWAYFGTKNARKTIVPKKETNVSLCDAVKLSEKDILKLHRMYNCD